MKNPTPTPTPTPKVPPKFGVYDTQDDCWMGRADGPLRYSDLSYARYAATVLTKMFEAKPGRYRGREIPDDVTEKRDIVEAQHTGSEAVKLLEQQSAKKRKTKNLS